MASSARIDELRKKFDENPRRYFAPLANEYRKIGDFDQAIFICQEYLPQQPGHMSGHIVYGQALFEIGRPDEARTVFETALTLDPENLIALRHLGDIASGGGDIEAARAWYQRVLEADPRNEEIAALLDSLRGQGEPERQEPSSQPEPPPPPPAVPAASRHTPPFSWGDAPVEPVSRSGMEAWSGEPLVVEHASEAPSSSPPQFAEQSSVQPSSDPDHELFDIADFNVGEQLFSASGSPPSAGSPEVEVGPVGGALAVSHIFESGTTAPAPVDLEETGDADTDAAQAEALFEADPFAITAAPEETPASPPAAAERARPPEADPRDEVIRAASDQGDAAFSTTAGEGAVVETPFVTETMAELYVSQGHRREAVDIYRKLVQRRPNEPALQERLAALEESETSGRGTRTLERSAPSTPSIRTFLRQVLWEWNAPAAAPEASVSPPEPVTDSASPGEPLAMGRRSLDDVVGGGPPAGSVDDLFPSGAREEANEARAALLADGYRVELGGGPLRGVPAHRATGELSLDHVFGARGSVDRSGGTVRSANGDRFFEQFFAGDASGPSGQPGPHAPGAGASADEDIAQFNSWLQGLRNT